MVNYQGILISWYQINKRDLPWRKTKDPYKIWLSEILLQQTRVNQGLPYYLKFVESYPTLKSLSNANEDDVLRLWQGLGYYSRARNMLATAKELENNYGGIFPTFYSEIIKLKGIGEYTAAAIASFSFDEKVAVVDGNVFRVLSRLFDVDTPMDSSAGKIEFKILANELLDRRSPAIFNQAIMEFGALQCTPKSPDCNKCVLCHMCASNSVGTVSQRPVKSKKTKTKKRFFIYKVFSVGNDTFIQKRSGKDIWQGLYEFPLQEFGDENEQLEYIEKHKNELLYQSVEITHILSHQRISAIFLCFKPNVEIDMPPTDLLRIPRNELHLYPVSVLIDNFLKNTNDLSFLSFDENVN
jgi:A/G-specific adenine glycosylase